MFACDVMWSHVYLSSYPPNHLCIYLSNYRASYRLFLIPWYKFAIPCLHLDWRLKIPQKLLPQIFNPPGGLTIRRKKSCGIFILKGKRLPSVYPFHSIPSVHPSILSTHAVHPSILSVHLHIYLPSYLFTYLSTYLPIYLAIYLSIHPSNYTFIQRCNPWVACGFKIQERTIFSPKKGTEGTDNKKHWEASKPTIKQNCTGFDTY